MRKSLEEVIELKSLMDNVFASMASGVITLDLEDGLPNATAPPSVILG
jgi:hypothetical protein